MCYPLFTDNFIRDLMLIIVLPLTLAVLFIIVVCIKVRPCSKPKPETSTVSKPLMYLLEASSSGLDAGLEIRRWRVEVLLWPLGWSCSSVDLSSTPWSCLTNRFHVGVHLSSNWSQMTSKCGKSKKMAHVAIAECVADVLTTFWSHLWYVTGQMYA